MHPLILTLFTGLKMNKIRLKVLVFGCITKANKINVRFFNSGYQGSHSENYLSGNQELSGECKEESFHIKEDNKGFQLPDINRRFIPILINFQENQFLNLIIPTC